MKTAALAVLPLLAVVVGSWFIPAGSATRIGEARVIAPLDAAVGAGKPLASGTTATPLTLELPPGASCRGDSANDGYKVQSYMVPEAVDPATLTFGSVGPVPTGTGAAFRQPLFDTATAPVVNHQTAAATKPPGPGPIVNIPAVDFMVYERGDIRPGTYNVGIACTKGPVSPTQLDTFWNTTLVITAGQGPGAAISWSAPASAAKGSTGGPGAGTAATAVEDAPTHTTRGATATITGASADSAVTADASERRLRPAEPTGAPPSLRLPVSGVGAPRLALAIWIALALVAVRIAVLLFRPSVRITAAAA